jgi:hypothetical protein
MTMKVDRDLRARWFGWFAEEANSMVGLEGRSPSGETSVISAIGVIRG